MGDILKSMEKMWSANAKEPFTPFIRTGFDHLRNACIIMDEICEKYEETKKGIMLDEVGKKRIREAFVEAEMAILFAGSEESSEAKYILQSAHGVMKIRHTFKK